MQWVAIKVFRVGARAPAVVVDRGMQRLRAIGNIVTEHARVVNNVLLDLLALARMLRLAPQAEEHLHLLIAFEHRVRQEADLLRVFALSAQPRGILIAVVGQGAEVFRLVYVDEMIRAVDFAKGFVKFLTVAPAIRLRPKKGEPRRGR